MSCPMDHIWTQVIRWKKGSYLAFGQTSYSNNLLPMEHIRSQVIWLRKRTILWPSAKHFLLRIFYLVEQIRYQVVHWERQNNSLAFGHTFYLKDLLPDGTIRLPQASRVEEAALELQVVFPGSLRALRPELFG